MKELRYRYECLHQEFFLSWNVTFITFIKIISFSGATLLVTRQKAMAGQARRLKRHS